MSAFFVECNKLINCEPFNTFCQSQEHNDVKRKTLSITENHEVDYNLYDALGRLVQRKKIYSNRKVKLDISEIPTGLYIVEVEGVRKKIIVE